ncbi:MAG: DUF3617 family protein [Bdellovibrionales bacterium]|nr:DUF3617 family protein [Bdellovibrionales bacterium]
MKLSRVALVSLLLPTAAFATDLPPIRSGLWAVESTNDGRSMGTTKQCVDKDMLQDLLSSSQKMMGGACEEMELKRDGSTYRSTVRCTIAGSKMVSESEMSGDFEKEYSTVTKTTMTPPMMGMGNTTQTTSAKFLGDCEAGMKPGDTILPDGQRMNVLTMMESVPDMGQMMKDMPDMSKLQEQMQKMQMQQSGQ